MPSKPQRHWPEAVVGLLGALPMVVTWLHVYSHTPSWHSEPTWTHAWELGVAAVIATVGAGWLLRGRLRWPWLAFVAFSLIAPILVVASGVIRTRTDQANVLPPVFGAWGAAAAYLLGAILIAAVPLRLRMIAAVVPLALALALGHVAYGLPAQTQYDIARSTTFPWPNETASDLLYGYQLES